MNIEQISVDPFAGSGRLRSRGTSFRPAWEGLRLRSLMYIVQRH
jgi:hypothetical protein